MKPARMLKITGVTVLFPAVSAARADQLGLLEELSQASQRTRLTAL